MNVTISSNNTISVGETITGYCVVQAPEGTLVRAWHNNEYPRPRDLGETVAMPKARREREGYPSP